MYRGANIAIGISTLISTAAFTAVLHTKIRWLVMIVYSLAGFTCSPTLVVTIAFCSEISIRIKETTSTALFYLWAFLIGTGVTYGSTAILHNFDDQNGVYVVNAILAFILMLGTVSSFLLEPINEQRLQSRYSVVGQSFIIQQKNHPFDAGYYIENN